MKTGYYEVEGNLVIYEGGNEAYDIDAASYIPIEVVEVLGEYVCSLEEGAEYY